MAGASAIALQQELIISTIRETAPREWKVLVLDTGSRKLVDAVTREDDILRENITNIEQIEERRPMNQGMDAVYLLSAQSHVLDCLMADFERRRYRRAYLIWTSALSPEMRARLDQSAMARDQIAQLRILNMDFFPRESHLITFRDPWSFPTLFHPSCNDLVRQHMEDLAQKIVSVCVSLGEYPTIRYYRPQNPTHEASVLCSHLAGFVQRELDQYAKYHQDFPPPSPRPRGALIITDRSMDLFAPIVHEFTYQAMVHDILTIVEAEKVVYRQPPGRDNAGTSTKEIEISEKDDLWVKNRHLHMKELLGKLGNEFREFKAKNPQFADSDDAPSSLNNIKDMLAGLPKYQQGKEAFALHLGMTSDAMELFVQRRLADYASVEQSLATGLDEDYKKPKNLADQVVRLLDDDAIIFPDRLRMIIAYLLYRDGLLSSDVQKLLAHAQLPREDGAVIHNLEHLGAQVSRALKDPRPVFRPLFQPKGPISSNGEESDLSRFNPVLQSVLEAHIRGSLDQDLFPFTKPHLDAAEGLLGQENVSQASLRSAKPTWARTRSSAAEPRQRIIIFVAGGATYSESRVCYEVSESQSKDVFLATSHMLSPELYLRQVGDLSVDRKRLGLPADRPKPQAPAHLFERPQSPPQASMPQSSRPAQQPLASSMNALSIEGKSANAHNPVNGSMKNQPLPPPPTNSSAASSTKLGKEKDKDSEKKKKHRFFGSKK